MAEKELIKALLTIPTEGFTRPQPLHNLLMQRFHLGRLEKESETDNSPYQFKFYTMSAGRMHHAFARDWLARNALDAGMDYILMSDDDMCGPIDLFERLFKHNVDVVAPKAFTRNPPHKCVMYSLDIGWDEIERKETMSRKYVDNYPETGLVECDAVGFGAALIKVPIIKKVIDKFGSAFMTSSANGEDVIFCNRAKKVGARIFMDMDTELVHLGNEVMIDSQYAKNFNGHDDAMKLYGAYSKYTEGLKL